VITEAPLRVRTPDGVIDTHIFQPDGRGPWPAVLFYMDALAIRPALGSMAQRLASNGYVVALPNLYYRSEPVEPFDKSTVFQDGPERQRFKSLIASITPTMVMSDTAAVVAALDGLAAVHTGRLGAVGYCMGGGLALRAASTFPDRIVAAASFHGGSLASDKEDSPHLLADRIRGRVYIGAAGIDPSFPPEQAQRLAAALDRAGVSYQLETYEGAKHGFAVTEHPVYDHAASERHWRALLRLFDETLS
jgi:carboxymethylenebutenolidase